MSGYLPAIDVSYVNGDISHALVGQSLVIIKASQRTFRDATFAAHRTQARRAGVPFGAYHFLAGDVAGDEQAKVFLAAAADAAFLVLDVEGEALHHADVARAFIAYVHAHDSRRVLLYSSRGTWPGDLGQDGNWAADYLGDPDRAGVSPRIPWLVWQHSGTGVDRDWIRDQATLDWLLGRNAPTPAPTPQPEGSPVRFIQLASADVVNLPSIAVPAGTPIEDFAGDQWDTIGPTNVHVLPGLVDAHSNRRAVVVSTGRFYADHQARPTAQVAVLK